jgi:transcriptional regulator with XRE-family HTH domain
MRAALGEFLRARRAAVLPADVGLPADGIRRVSGLRREEVAALASISVDYYTRLEQGRELHPSLAVLDALARTFALDDDARQHLLRLAGLAPGRPDRAGRQEVGEELLRLMERWSQTPALVIDRALEILARNGLGRALFADFAEPGNLARMVFLDPVARRFYRDWDRAAASTAAHLRLAAGVAPHDPLLRALIDELEASSEPFRALWARQEVRGKTREAKRLRHAAVGELTLSYLAFDVRSAPGQELIVYQAEPDGHSAEKIAQLGRLAAPAEA